MVCMTRNWGKLCGPNIYLFVVYNYIPRFHIDAVWCGVT